MSEKRNIRFVGRILCMMLSLLLAVSLVPVNASAAGMKLSYSSITLTKGYKKTLKVTGASNVKWSSSDTSVASVTSKGIVFAKKAGTAYIYAKSGNSSVKCRVRVVNGKLTVSQTTVNLTEGESETLKVTAVGSHSMRAESSDKSVAKASWVQPWSGNNISLKITGVSEGTATIKVYMSKYTEISKTVRVNVEADEYEENGDDLELLDENDNTAANTGVTSHLMTDRTALSVFVGGTDTIKVYTDKKDKITAVSGDTSVVTLSAPVWNENYGEYTVTGVKSGTAVITVSASDNKDLKQTVAVTVQPKGDYFDVCDFEPQKKVYNDIILRWTVDGKNKYMLVYAGYDQASANTAIARSSKKFEYYTVYDTAPEKLADSDKIESFEHTVSGKNVVRYVLCPEKYDDATLQTVVAKYTGKYLHWVVYSEKPNLQAGDDVIRTWTANVDGQTVTRYILLPNGYDEKTFEELKKKDSSASGKYYVVALDPALIPKIDNSDIVESFRYVDSTGAVRNAFILLPAGYDAAARATSIAKFTGQYDYFIVYTESPKKNISSDVIKSWKKVVNNQVTTRYVLLPNSYTEDAFNRIRDNDVQNGGTVYYTALTSAPNYNAASGEQIYSWTNPSTGTRRYMILPSNYSIVKRNDAVCADTGVYEYYKLYSTKPSPKSDKDTVYSFTDAAYGTCYILLPENYSNDKLNKAMNGQDVSV